MRRADRHLPPAGIARRAVAVALRASATAGLLIAAIALVAVPTSAGAQDAPALRDYAAVLPLLQPERRAQLQQRAAIWAGWDASRRREFVARSAAWDALPAAERGRRREQFLAWQALPPAEQAAVQGARTYWASLAPTQQQALRARFDALDASERRGWWLGPELGADYRALQPLLAQVPPAEHAPLLRVLRAMSREQRRNLAVLLQRTPPQERERLRSGLLSTSASNREQWLWLQLDR